MKHLLTFLLLWLSFCSPCAAQEDEEVYATCRAYSMSGMEQVQGGKTKDEKPKKKTGIKGWFACVPVDMANR